MNTTYKSSAEGEPLLRHTPSHDKGKPSWDLLVVIALVFASMQIFAFGETAVPQEMRIADVLRHPILGNILPEQGEANLSGRGPRPAEPIALILQACTLGFLILYALADLAMSGRWRQWIKWLFLCLILATALYLPTAKFILLRDISGPASYTHDGGVIQTEATIQYLLEGKNPYSEDYTETPMAEWGFDEYRTALYHYPYLPWTFVFSAPFYLLGNSLGLFDQRLVYLLLLTAMLIVAPKLVNTQAAKLSIVAALALNPIMSLDVLYGQNDVFVLSWIVLSLYCLNQWLQQQASGMPDGAIRWRVVAAILFGLACASKPTAWFFAPFFGLLLVADVADKMKPSWQTIFSLTPQIIRRAAPALIAFAVLLLPYVIWDPYALYEDVWRWSTGQGETGYQIWGWGASNFVLGLGLVEGRFSQWPFGYLELVIALPVLLWLIRRQIGENTISTACIHYGLGLLTFFYTSRFLNENYLGYIFAFLAIGFLLRIGNHENH